MSVLRGCLAVSWFVSVRPLPAFSTLAQVPCCAGGNRARQLAKRQVMMVEATINGHVLVGQPEGVGDVSFLLLLLLVLISGRNSSHPSKALSHFSQFSFSVGANFLKLISSVFPADILVRPLTSCCPRGHSWHLGFSGESFLFSPLGLSVSSMIPLFGLIPHDGSIQPLVDFLRKHVGERNVRLCVPKVPFILSSWIRGLAGLEFLFERFSQNFEDITSFVFQLSVLIW